jgi:hypothetical protein
MKFLKEIWPLAFLALAVTLYVGVSHQERQPQEVIILAQPLEKMVVEIDGLPKSLVLAAIVNGKGDIRYSLVMRGKTAPSFREGASLREEYQEKYPADIVWVDANTVWVISVYPEPNPRYFRVIESGE